MKYNAQYLIEIPAENDQQAKEYADQLQHELSIRFAFTRLNLITKQEGNKVETIYDKFK